MGWLWTLFLKRSGTQTLLLHRGSETQRSCQLEQGKSTTICNTPSAKASEATLPPLQALLVTTKAFAVKTALLPLREQLQSQRCPIILAQNGMGLFEEVRECFPDQPLLLLSTSNGAYRVAPERVRHTGTGNSYLGCLDDSVSAEARVQLVETLQRTEAPVIWEPKMARRLWEKLVVNCAINSLTALWNCRNGDLLQLPPAERLMNAIATEATEVMAAALAETVSLPELLQRTRDVAEKTSANYSSMCEDRHFGKPTEVEYIQGFVARQAAQYGIPTPTLSTIVELLRVPHFHRPTTQAKEES